MSSAVRILNDSITKLRNALKPDGIQESYDFLMTIPEIPKTTNSFPD